MRTRDPVGKSLVAKCYAEGRILPNPVEWCMPVLVWIGAAMGLVAAEVPRLWSAAFFCRTGLAKEEKRP